MDPAFTELRAAIYSTEEERKRFRQLLVNIVMATDIVDKELKQLRNDRWDKAFHEDKEKFESSRENINRKATIVLEHLIQASDIAHTMQHWHVYRVRGHDVVCHIMFDSRFDFLLTCMDFADVLLSPEME